MMEHEDRICDIRAVPEGGSLIGFLAYMSYPQALELMQKGFNNIDSVFLRTDLDRKVPQRVIDGEVTIVNILIQMDVGKDYYLNPLNHLN